MQHATLKRLLHNGSAQLFLPLTPAPSTLPFVVVCEGTLHSQVVAFCALPVDCQDMPRHVLVPRCFCVISCRRRRQKFACCCPHTHFAHRTSHCSCFAFGLRQLAAKVAAFHFFPSYSTPPTAAATATATVAATRSQLGLVIHTSRCCQET